MTVLFFLSTIIIFLCIDFFIQRKVRLSMATQPRTKKASPPLRAPSGIFFTPSHTWLSLFPSGTVRIGVDDFILRMMESPEIVLLKKPGVRTHKGEPLFQIKEGARTLTVQSPIDGEILEVNDDVQKHPAILKEMLFSNGWAYTVKPQRTSELTHMLLGENTKAWVQQEFGRLRDFIAGATASGSLAPALLQDGGIPVDGVLTKLNDKQLERFEEQFLSVH